MFRLPSSGRCIVALVAAAIAVANSQPASAGLVVLDFVNITGNAAPQHDVVGQLKVIVTDEAVNLHTVNGGAYSSVYANAAGNQIGPAAAGHMHFIFLNLGALASTIAEVYFDDGTLLAIGTPVGSTGVNFVAGSAAPPDLPGGNSLSEPFEVTAGFLADANDPAPHNGVGPGDWLLIDFELKKDINDVPLTYGDVYAALYQGAGNGGLRIGMHVIGLGGGESDSFVNKKPPQLPDIEVDSEVPEPASLVLASIGGLGAVVMGRRRRKQQQTA